MGRGNPNYLNALLPRKASKDMVMILVPRTNTRGWGENPQASEQTIVKELGKLAPDHIDGSVWHLDVDSSHPGGAEPSKGWAVRPLKRTRGPEWTDQWCTSCLIKGTAGQLSGKSTLAKAIQELSEEKFLYVGIDTLFGALPRKIVGSDQKAEAGFRYVIDPKTENLIEMKEELGGNSEKFVPVGTLARINLDISAEANLEPIINSLKEIQLRELDERALDELTEKFVRHLPDILEKSKLSSVEKLPYMTMMRGNERLEILINIPDRQKIDKEAIERKLRKKGTYGSNEMRKHLEKLEKGNYPDNVKKVIQEEIERYEMMPGNSSEANIIKQYVDWLVNLPWYQKTEEISDLEFARRKLNEKHYGLSEIKEKIIEYLAAQQKANKSLGQVICLAGPPGVGKTSLAASIAEATGRKFISISVGGVRDVAEVQGHRRTYIGAMPGRIIQAMKKAQVINPCFLIDEVDKFSSDYRGDPAYALLEALDPNQNKKFIDNYLGEEVPYNLSEVMFICTANDEREIPLPLLDRMEVIRLSSYTEIEKFHIVKEYIIPESLKKHNLNAGEIVFEDQAIRDIIKHYTREAGVRELNRKIQTIVRKFIVQLLQNRVDKAVITPDNLMKDYLKKKDYEFTSKIK
ncbi:1741_t:CDS:2, partial [Paraglomus occultum]